MTIVQIKTHIDQLEKKLFFHSLRKMKIEELEQLQDEVRGLKRNFLETCFIGHEVEELEEVRFKLMEISCMITIYLNELLPNNSITVMKRHENLLIAS